MAYATVAELRATVKVPAGAEYDTRLLEALEDATDMIDGALGFSFAAYGAGAAKDVRTPGNVSDTFRLPAHQVATPSTVTTVLQLSQKGATGESTTAITDFDELEDGRLYRAIGWWPNTWYRITAPWGYGPAPKKVVRICKEVAVNLFVSGGSGQFTDVLGVDGGGAVAYQRALTNRQRAVIEECQLAAGQWGIG